MPTIPLLEAIAGSMGMPNRRRPLLTDADVIAQAAQEGVPSWQLPLSEEGEGRVARNLLRRKEWEQQQGAAGARMNPSTYGFGVAPIGPAVSRAQALQGAERDYAAQASRDLGLNVLPVTKSWVDSTGTTPVQLPNGKVMLVGPKASPEPNPGMNFRDWDSLRRQQPGFESTRRLGQESQQRVNEQNAATLATSALDRAAKRAAVQADPRHLQAVARTQARRAGMDGESASLYQAIVGNPSLTLEQRAALADRFSPGTGKAMLAADASKTGKMAEQQQATMPMLIAGYANVLAQQGKAAADDFWNKFGSLSGLIPGDSGLAPGQANVPPVGQAPLAERKAAVDAFYQQPIAAAAGITPQDTPGTIADKIFSRWQDLSESDIDAMLKHIDDRAGADQKWGTRLGGGWSRNVLNAIRSAPAGQRKAAIKALIDRNNEPGPVFSPMTPM